MDEKQKKFLNALNVAFSPNPEAVIKILSLIPSPEEAFKINQSQLLKLGFRTQTISNFLNRREKIDIEKEWKKIEKQNIRLITKDEPEYPKLLKEIAKPPVALYIKGKLLPNEQYLASVGTRWPSDYGKIVTNNLIGELCQSLTIVSGMARGIDSLSHKAAIERERRTVAVLGSGLDIIFPPENKNLSQKIEKNGALISEFPLGTPPLQYNFPLRNRIIAGMSLATLVIEGKKTSGSLITANIALEEGREVFAVPGPIFSKTSEGPNNLIKEGAHPVTEANDVLSQLNIEKPTKEEVKIKAETKEEGLIIELLKQHPASIDQIIRETKINPSKINSTLILMEIKGMVKRSGNLYTLAKN